MPFCLHEIYHLLTTTPSFTDNIESNISSVEVNVREADRELTTAADYQRKAGKRGACLMIIIGIVVTIVLIAVRVLFFVLRHMYLYTSLGCMLGRKVAVSFHLVVWKMVG